ncbi:hypothetical protein [Flaviaesturariibacter aridisoli]|uniref:Uncharacterized protein n=1 Tax=Flaviaesturariibacter aridisoli TaxID=2545761 RepID=A0A4V6P656_9BACT|nr:hypothetical protein [Flaviaesturariibacter aridisoli]TCZ67724.1 hypothetical protein E0486_15295 [Flaviaesturariibacter aridisoli]
MRKIMFLFVALLAMVSSFASVTPTDVPKNANNIMIPVGSTGKAISLKALSTISIKEYEQMSGRHLGMFDRMGFKKAQKQLRKNIATDGTLKGKLAKRTEGEGFSIGGFALGFFLGLIGVLIAYVAFSDEGKSNRIKWSWIGLGAAVLLSIILVVAVFSSVKNSVD